jgi:hypothetical protein
MIVIEILVPYAHLVLQELQIKATWRESLSHTLLRDNPLFHYKTHEFA